MAYSSRIDFAIRFNKPNHGIHGFVNSDGTSQLEFPAGLLLCATEMPGEKLSAAG